MAYISEGKTKTVKLVSDPKYWVKVATELRWKDSKLFTTFQENDMAYALDKLLLTLIVEWNLDDDEGNIIPVTAENIDRLKRLDAEALVAAVGAVVQKEAPTQKKSS